MAHHLTMEERDRIAQLRSQKCSNREIAVALNRSASTIGRELARNSVRGEYFPAQAQARAEQRRRERPFQRKMDRTEIDAFVRQGLIQYWSPDQIAGRLKRQLPQESAGHVSRQTIYNWIMAQDVEDRQHWQQFLRRRGKRPWQRRKATGQDLGRGTIADRPAVIERRQRLGDFEGDTVLGPPGTGGLVTLVDRHSRFTMLTKIRRKQARHVHQRIKQRLRTLTEDRRRSLTFDNGSEFSRCPLLEKHLAVGIYFAEPGRPYQRGTNENTNGLLRQFYPKGSDFRDISHHDVRQTEELLNDRPRACLGYRTPREVFLAKSASTRCD